MKKILKRVILPVHFTCIGTNLGLAMPRILAGISLSLEFGSSKFGMPWSITKEIGLFQVASWFPEDVARFGIPFSLAPTLFAWLGAASEAIGGIFLAMGLGTRIVGSFVAITMLTAIFLQKWPDAIEYGSTWPLLPAAGFLWISLNAIMFGSGKFGIDALLSKRLA